MKYLQHLSRKAVWSQRLALVFFLLFAITFGLHRFSKIDTPAAMKLFGLAAGGAVTALLLGIAALVNVWQEGFSGGARALRGCIIAVIVLALPVWSLPDLLMKPRLHDVTTDAVSPPAFQKIATLRKPEANPIGYLNTAAEQGKAYPEVLPIAVNRPPAQVYAAVRQAVAAFSWKIVSEEPPAAGRAGIIEATDRTLIFGFTDDVSIRVTGDGGRSRVDARSASRYGGHDLGRNARRLTEFFAEVKTRLAAIDQDEQMKKAVVHREEVANRRGSEAKRRRRDAEEAAARAAPPAPLKITVPDQAAGVMSDGTQAGQTPDAAAQQAPSPSVTGDGQAPTKQPQRASKRKGSGKFWEQFGQ